MVIYIAPQYLLQKISFEPWPTISWLILHGDNVKICVLSYYQMIIHAPCRIPSDTCPGESKCTTVCCSCSATVPGTRRTASTTESAAPMDTSSRFTNTWPWSWGVCTQVTCLQCWLPQTSTVWHISLYVSIILAWFHFGFTFFPVCCPNSDGKFQYHWHEGWKFNTMLDICPS